MGACFSKCRSKTEVLRLSSPVASISDSLPSKSPVSNTEPESRRFRKKTSAKSAEKASGDGRNADEKRPRWCFRGSRPLDVVSPMHDDGEPINIVRRLPVRKNSFVEVPLTTDNSTQNISGTTKSLNVSTVSFIKYASCFYFHFL